jgi:hypothetical protein
MLYSLHSKAKPQKGEHSSSSTLDAGSSTMRSTICQPPVTAMKSFRDVVVTRTLPRSMAGEKSSLDDPVAEQEEEPDNGVQAPDVGSDETSSISLGETSDEDDGNGPWITVQLRCSRSMESLRKLWLNNKLSFNLCTLN